MSDFCTPMNCSPSGFPVHEMSQARILEWVAISFSGESSQPRVWTHVSYIAGRFFVAEPLAVSIYILKYNLKSCFIVKMESFYLVWKQKNFQLSHFYSTLSWIFCLSLKVKKQTNKKSYKDWKGEGEPIIICRQHACLCRKPSWTSKVSNTTKEKVNGRNTYLYTLVRDMNNNFKSFNPMLRESIWFLKKSMEFEIHLASSA